MYIHRARGAFFKVKLPTFKYTITAKGIGVECARDLIYELKMYHRLLLLQGKYMSMHLKDTKVDSLLYYVRAIYIVYMMFLSFKGFPL